MTYTPRTKIIPNHSTPSNSAVYFLFRVIIGLTQFTNKAHIARATLEAVCFQTREVREGMIQQLELCHNMLSHILPSNWRKPQNISLNK